MSLHVRVSVGDESYALAVEGVREVADLGDVAPVPGAPRAIRGVRNVHGQVMPVVDLGTVLGAPSGDRCKRLVVAEHEGRLAGLAVDAVIGVEGIPAAEEDVDSRFLTGAALSDGALVGVIDLRAVLDAVQGEAQ
jgi:purine-binding chemotaxis protein CheW